MTVIIEKEGINLREELAKMASMRPPAQRQTFPFTGNSSTTTFTLPPGWVPFAVYSAGLRRRVGPGNDYTVTFDGFRHSVLFAVAPAAVFIEIDAERPMP